MILSCKNFAGKINNSVSKDKNKSLIFLIKRYRSNKLLKKKLLNK